MKIRRAGCNIFLLIRGKRGIGIQNLAIPNMGVSI
jgi:hypothetical protein